MNQHEFIKILIKENMERQLLYEGLIFSYSPKFIMPRLIKLGYKDISYNGKTINIKFQLSNQNKEKYEELNTFLTNVCGWFHGVSVTNNSITDNKLDFLNHKVGNVFLQYEPKFDIEIDKIPDTLYHLTTCDKLNKVLSNGLTPRTSTQYFNFENRIYLSTNKDVLINFAKQKSNINKTDCFIILQLYISTFTNRIRFFKDPNFTEGIYTLENIPKETIEPIEKITIDNENNVSVNPF